MWIDKIGTGLGLDFFEKLGLGVDLLGGGIGIGEVSLLPVPAFVLFGQSGEVVFLLLHFALLFLPHPVVLSTLF